MTASVPCPYHALYRFNSSPLLLLSGSLARITHCRTNLFLIKLLWNVGKANEEEVGVKRSLGRAKYFIAPSIAHCDWVVYAVNTGDKPMGHWLLTVSAWWSLANIYIKKTFCRPLKCVGPRGKCPVCPITNPALAASLMYLWRESNPIMHCTMAIVFLFFYCIYLLFCFKSIWDDTFSLLFTWAVVFELLSCSKSHKICRGKSA